MRTRVGQPPKATRDDWVAAALAAMSTSGLSGVSVEGLARQLSISKGSFYGYFSSREELIAQTLQFWIAEHKRIVVTPLQQIKDPRIRFRALTDGSIHAQHGIDLEAVTRMFQLELQMMAFRDDPSVAATLEQVNASRIELLSDTLMEIGIGPSIARKRAVAGQALTLGIHMLTSAAPSVSDEIDHAYIEEITTLFLSSGN